MKASEFITEQELADLDEKSTRKLCLSRKPDSKLGASNLSSCVAQGLRPRSGEKKRWYRGKRQNVDGIYIKSKKYGGTI